VCGTYTRTADRQWNQAPRLALWIDSKNLLLVGEQIDKAIDEHTAHSFHQPDTGVTASMALHPFPGHRREYLKALHTEVGCLTQIQQFTTVGVRQIVINIGFFKV
jgi:hypothetical protein